MFRNKPDNHLAADLVADDATAQAHALALQPTVGPSAASATVTAQIQGQGLFVRVVVDEDLPPLQRELVAELARAQVVRLLRNGTGEGGWTWDATACEWRAVVDRTNALSILVPDYVPVEWVRAA